jgi:hypothetical protein
VFHCHAVAKTLYANMEQEVTEAQHVFSSETEATVARAVPMLEWLLQTRWEQMAEHERYRPLAPAIRVGLDNLRKWYKELDISDAYIICHSTLSLLLVVATQSDDDDGALWDVCSSRPFPQTRICENALGH